MKQLVIITLFLVVTGCAKVNTTNEFVKGDVLLKLNDTDVQTVLYQGLASNGQPFFHYPSASFWDVVRRSTPKVHLEVQKEFGTEIFSYELKKYDLNNDNLITVEEFSRFLSEADFAEDEINLFITTIKEEFKR